MVLTTTIPDHGLPDTRWSLMVVIPSAERGPDVGADIRCPLDVSSFPKPVNMLKFIDVKLSAPFNFLLYVE